MDIRKGQGLASEGPKLGYQEVPGLGIRNPKVWASERAKFIDVRRYKVWVSERARFGHQKERGHQKNWRLALCAPPPT